MQIAEVAKRLGVAPSAIRWYEQVGVVPRPARRANGYRDFSDTDLSRLQLVVALRRLGVDPEDAGRLARLCLEQGAVDVNLQPVLADQRASIERQRSDLDRLEAELIDLENTIAAATRSRRREHVPEPLRVLFVCTHNSARSQIAEALLSRYGGANFEVHSGGTVATRVNSFTVRVLAEQGIDWATAESKTIDRFLNQRFDYVITVCDRARESCPVFPGSTNTLHWGLDDPSELEGTDEEKLQAFRQTAKEVSVRLRPFIEVAMRAAGRTARATIA